MIAAEQDAVFGQRKAQMVRGVAGRVHRLEPPAGAGDLVAVVHGDIGGEIPVAAFLDAALAAPAAGMRAKAVGRGPGRRLQRLRRRRMVVMRMGYQDMGHLLAGETREQCGDMLVEIGAGVDDGDLALADDIGAGALEGERARVARDDAADAGRHRFEPAILERHVAAERDIDCHDAGEYTRSSDCLIAEIIAGGTTR